MGAGCRCCDAVAYHLTKAMVKFTCAWFWACIVLILILTGVATPFVRLSDFGGDDWTIGEHITSVNKDAINNAKSQVDESVNKKKNVREREVTNTKSGGSIIFLYDWTEENRREDDENIFTPSNLQKMCQIEHLIIDDAKYSDYCKLKYVDENGTETNGCEPQSSSIPEMFYNFAKKKYNGDCPLLDADEVADSAQCGFYRAFVEDEQDIAYQCNCWNYWQDQNKIDPTKSFKCDSKCSNCTLPPQIKLFKMPAEMKTGLQQKLGGLLSAGIKSKSPPSSGITRSILSLGYPLFKNGKELTEAEAEDELKPWLLDIEAKLFKRFGMKHFVVSSAYFQTAEAEGLRVRFFNGDLLSTEFSLLVNSDLSWLGGSVFFVIIYLRIHTGSYFLALLGIFQIFFSLPVSLFFYRIVFQIDYFSQLHILVLFLVLGVGADDIFVLVDAWKQSLAELDEERSDDEDEFEYNGAAHERLAFAFKRAALAVFNTSFTTCMAFLATAVSPIMPISTFGIFAALCILMNYIFTVLFTPVVVLIWHRFWETKDCCCCCADKPVCKPMYWLARASKAKAQRFVELKATEQVAVVPFDSDQLESAKDEGSDASKFGELVVYPEGSVKTKGAQDEKDRPGCSFESCFGGCCFNLLAYRVLSQDPDAQKNSRCTNGVMGTSLFTTSPIVLRSEYNHEVSKGTRCFPVLSLLVILLLGTVAGLSFWQASLLTPPRSTEKWLPLNHMFQAVIDDGEDKFYAGESDTYAKVSITWGVEGVDRSIFNRYFPNENRGTALFDDSFAKMLNFGSAESSSHTHQALKEVCAVIDKFPCEGLLNDKLAYSGSMYDNNTKENCWPYHLEESVKERSVTGSMPGSDQEAYGENLKKFRSEHKTSEQNIGFIDGNLKFLSLSFRAGLKRNAPAKMSRLTYDCAKKLEDEIRSTFKDKGFKGMDKFKIIAGGKWTGMISSESLVNGLFTGLGICFPVAAVVLLLSSGNVFIATYAVVCIASIVGFVLGFCKWAMNWDLGTAQSIAGVIVIGFSVDYCVHLAHMYTEAQSRSARGRSQHALSTMGGTVLGGAITTFGSGVFLFPCQITFFTTMAWLISMTILAALAYSLGLFMALCIMLGPDNNFGDIYFCCKRKKE